MESVAMPVDEFSNFLGAPADLDPELAECIHKVGDTDISMIAHPLIHEVFYTPLLNGHYNNRLVLKRKLITECIKKKQWGKAIFLHERPYRIEAFMSLVCKMQTKQLNKLFAEVYVDSENLFQSHEVIQFLIRTKALKPKYMLNKKEMDFLKNLPAQIRVYRGYQVRADFNNIKGYSWTLSRNTAWWFANRLSGNCKPCVATGIVNKKAILGVFLGRGENEIFVDPEDVMEIEDDQAATITRPQWLEDVWKVALSVFRLGSKTFHGRLHWENVERNAVFIGSKTANVDMEVIQIFAAIHDCKRQDEGTDPEHGDRSASFAKELFERGLLPITDGQLKKLQYACKYHQKEKRSNDPTIGTCWDADRLDLYRVGIVPLASYFSTDAGKELLQKGILSD